MGELDALQRLPPLIRARAARPRCLTSWGSKSLSAPTGVHARDIAPTSVAVAEIQRCDRPRFALAEAVNLTMCLYALLRERIASRLTLDAGAVADMAIGVERLLQAGRGTAIGTCHKVGADPKS